jgi:hypothetical protein
MRETRLNPLGSCLLVLVSWFFFLFARKGAETCLRQTGAKKSNREQLYLFGS